MKYKHFKQALLFKVGSYFKIGRAFDEALPVFLTFLFLNLKKDTILLFNILIGVTAWNIAGTLYSLYAFI